MSEQQPQHETLAEQTIRRYRSEESLQRTAKRKKISTAIFVANILIIAVLYMFFAQNKADNRNEYRSTTLNYKNLQFRFSFMKEQATKNYIFSLTTKGAPGRETTAYFNNGIADLIISHGSVVLVKLPLGKGVSFLPLKPDELDLQKTVIDYAEMKVYTDGHPEYVVTPQRSLFSAARPYIPLTAEVRIHADQPVSTALQFNFEVNQ
jgi:hypothetical protein